MMSKERLEELKESFEYEHPVNECLEEIERLQLDLADANAAACIHAAEHRKLRDEVETLRKICNGAFSNGKLVIDTQQEQLQATEAERDQLRADVTKQEEAYTDVINQFRVERDQLRAEVEHLQFELQHQVSVEIDIGAEAARYRAALVRIARDYYEEDGECETRTIAREALGEGEK